MLRMKCRYFLYAYVWCHVPDFARVVAINSAIYCFAGLPWSSGTTGLTEWLCTDWIWPHRAVSLWRARMQLSRTYIGR